MTVRNSVATPSLDWQRVTALSGSFSAHALAALLIALPLARPLQREVPHVFEAALVERKPPPPALPPPPETLPLPRAKPPRTPPVTHSLPPQPTPTAPTDSVAPVDVPTPTSPTRAAPTNGPSTDAPTAAAGETRTLAWDGAPRLRYPPQSLRLREQGTVLLHVLVDADGTAQRIEIARSSGYPKLDAAAREAVQHARFRAVLQDGRAVPAWGVVPIEFRLDRG